MKFYSIVLFSILLLFACNTVEKDNKYFAGDIYTYSDVMPAKRMSCDTLQVEGVYQGPAFVYDSLLFYFPINPMSTCLYEIYNLKDQSFLGSYFNKGGGPNEFFSLTTIFQFYKENGDLKTKLYAMNENKLVDWNISESIRQKKTIIDTLTPYDWMTDEHTTSYNYLFQTDSNTFFAAVPVISLTLDRSTVSLPLYEKRTIDTNRKLQSYTIFKATPEGNESNMISREFFLSSYFAVKPSLDKMVQAMVYLPQLNILDFATGTVKGFRAQGTDFSVFEKSNGEPKVYYMGLCATNRFIIVLNLDLKKGGDVSDKKTFIQIFNWDGKLVNKIDLGGFYNQMTVDEVNNILYVRNNNSEYLYAYNLNDL